MKKIAIFASGSGSNARQIVEYFRDHPSVCVHKIFSNKPSAGVLVMAKENHIPSTLLKRETFFDDDKILKELEGIDLIVLAGFLWKIPSYLINAFTDQIINIHPALLPLYGGKGMYGKFVHQAVRDANDDYSGMTIHYVNDQYDEGKHIFQALCKIDENDSAADIGARVLHLEHAYYAPVIESLLHPL